METAICKICGEPTEHGFEICSRCYLTGGVRRKPVEEEVGKENDGEEER